MLLDIPRIAPCFPGAELTEVLEDDRYKGRAGVKVGPVNLFFAGEAQIVERDDTNHTARVRARGNDTKGRGQASAMVDFSLEPVADGSRVNVKTDLNMTGAVAQYGRASGLMKEIAGALIGEFADNLAGEIKGADAAPAAPAAETQTPAAGDDVSAATGSSRSTQAAHAAKPISAFSLFWKAFVRLDIRCLGSQKR